MFRREKHLVEERPRRAVSAVARRHKQQQEQSRHIQRQESRNSSHELEDDWRQAAQMLTDDEEILLAVTGNSRSNSARATPDSSQYINQQDYLVEDDNSSISFAQSGCHSILSAWRAKSAAKARRAEQAAKISRPTSVLSNTSSAKKSVASTVFTLRDSRRAPASQNRIPLGPRQDHFVTNSRRRRRANELILNTLEARRRAIALNRQNASLLGSASYLNAPDCFSEEAQLLYTPADPTQRLSLSPSPLSYRGRSPSPAPRRSALSDLGGTRQTSSPAQRNVLRNLATRPPLAKLDQNSSDLYTSNSSASEDSESSGSQFTQLVTNELAPDCVLLEEQVLRSRLSPVKLEKPSTRVVCSPGVRTSRPIEPAPRPPVRPPAIPPKVPERRKKEQKIEKEPVKRVDSVVAESNTQSKFRRAALRRDSIRRLRLNRQSKVASNANESSSYSSDTVELSPGETLAEQNAKQQARKLDIENNPFLNRGHFRSTSVRSTSNTRSELSSVRNEPRLSGGQQERRNSWLASREIERRAPSPRQQLQFARRSNSTEPIDQKRPPSKNFNDVNKVSKQSAASSTNPNREEVIRVERMLRQMKPNQVFTSYAEQKSQTISKQSSSIESKPEQMFIRRGTPSPQPNVRLDSTTVQRLDSPASKSQVEFDRRMRQEELRSHVESRSSRSGCSEKMDLFRASSISPPAGFRNSKPATPVKPRTRLVVEEQRIPLSQRNVDTESNRLSAARSNSSINPNLNKSQENLPNKSTLSRPTSVERPPVAARKRVVSSQASQETQRPVSLQPTLPTFERTADDEFRKRVDYLRRLAKANLDSAPHIERQKASVQTSSVSPSTDWQRHSVDPSKDSQTLKPLLSLKPVVSRDIKSSSSLFDERAKWKIGPLADKTAASEIKTEPATTNLDSILTDRYQSREHKTTELPKWQRSNSSLASLGQSRGNADSNKISVSPVRPLSPLLLSREEEKQQSPPIGTFEHSNINQTHEIPSQWDSKTREQGGGQQQGTSSVMKLMVREKSAPRLNYALIEQQPNVQHALRRMPIATGASSSQVEEKNPKGNSNLNSNSNQTLFEHQKPTTSSQRQTFSAPTRNRSPPMRVPAARSPEFGALAASSNDDSAIASSVSNSPSLSYMLNTTRQSSQRHQGSPSSQSTVVSRPQLLGLRQVKLAESVPSGALQSILRRAHQQQQSTESSDSSSSLSQQQQQQQQAVVESRRLQPSSSEAGQQRAISPRPQQAPTQANLVQAAPDISPPKRVHFNDMASVRSFESISSINSNSTAVPNELALLRHQVGSPDSMGSGSGRQSVDSPDSRKGGAAIYAVRGESELDMDPTTSLINAIGLQTTANLTRHPYGQSPQLAGYPPIQRRNPAPFIQMTAPPSINTTGQMQLQQQMHGYIVKPTSATQIMPTSYRHVQMPQPELEEDEDPSYALRLRQAVATSRMAFQYPAGVMLSPQQQQQIMMQQQQVRMISPVQQLTQQQAGQQVHQSSKRPLNPADFQTEV